MNSPINPSPQFGTAEYLGVQGRDHCQYCHQPIGGTYYRVHDAMACPVCTEKVRVELAKDTHAVYMRALLFGIGAAIAGMALYATFVIVTGWIIGYVALAVGWMVGTAIKKGSGGIGGKRYQITAAALTYAAVSMAAIPVGIHYFMEHRQEFAEKAQSKAKLAEEQKHLENGQGQPSPGTADSPSEPSAPVPEGARPSLLGFFGHLVWLGIASPFLEFQESGPTFGWILGIFILFIGIRIAWRLTAGVQIAIHGPFDTATQPT